MTETKAQQAAREARERRFAQQAARNAERRGEFSAVRKFGNRG